MRVLPALCALSLVVCAACGASNEPPVETAASAKRTKKGHPDLPDPPPGPWSETSPDELRDLVEKAAMASIAVDVPDFDEAMLETWLADPTSSPPLSDPVARSLLRLVLVDLTAPRHDRAEHLIRLVRARAVDRHMAFVGTEMLAEIRRIGAGKDEDAQRKAIADAFRDLPLPRFPEAGRALSAFPSIPVLGRFLKQVYDAPLGPESAAVALYMGHFLPPAIAARELYLEVFRSQIPKRIESLPVARERAIAALEEGAREVRMAVWDLGVSGERLGDRLFRNPNEKENGRDDDGNGAVDDLFGLVFDGTAPHTALLFEPAAEARSEESLSLLTGLSRLQAGLEWFPDARQAAEALQNVRSAEEQGRLQSRLEGVAEWARGTHAASVIVEGNPGARLAVFRSGWAADYRAYPNRAPSDEDLAREAEQFRAIAAFIQTHGIRVVYVDVGSDPELIADSVRRAQGVRVDEEAVAARVEAIQAKRAEAFRSVFSACPNTLFVVGAGNAGRNVREVGELPATLDAPNLLPIGALDPWGEWAIFTNFGERVTLFDRGVDVEGLAPDGTAFRLSGTASAAARVGNLAGKILALHPDLDPAGVRELLDRTGDEVAAPFTGKAPSGARALETARAEAPPAPEPPPPTRARTPRKAGKTP